LQSTTCWTFLVQDCAIEDLQELSRVTESDGYHKMPSTEWEKQQDEVEVVSSSEEADDAIAHEKRMAEEYKSVVDEEVKLKEEEAATPAVKQDLEPVPAVGPFVGLTKSLQKRLERSIKEEAVAIFIESERLRIEAEEVELRRLEEEAGEAELQRCMDEETEVEQLQEKKGEFEALSDLKSWPAELSKNLCALRAQHLVPRMNG
jgi:hypothetical protein